MKLIYIVHCKRGRLRVEVEQFTIALRGERHAVAQAAWFQLMGQNSLGEYIDKKSLTRKELQLQIQSRLEHERSGVFEMFKQKINFTWVAND